MHGFKSPNKILPVVQAQFCKPWLLKHAKIAQIQNSTKKSFSTGVYAQLVRM